MKDSARYVKIVEWSDEDHCFVGSCPGLFYGGCHGDDEKAVFAELCEIVEEMIELYRKDGKPLPPATSGRDYANKMFDVALAPKQRDSPVRHERRCNPVDERSTLAIVGTAR
jgi:predicted RNase H-like HicB family nuclease